MLGTDFFPANIWRAMVRRRHQVAGATVLAAVLVVSSAAPYFVEHPDVRADAKPAELPANRYATFAKALSDGYQAYLRSRRPPTLAVWGPQDGYMPEDSARAYLRDLPDAVLHLLPDAGHCR